MGGLGVNTILNALSIVNAPQKQNNGPFEGGKDKGSDWSKSRGHKSHGKWGKKDC